MKFFTIEVESHSQIPDDQSLVCDWGKLYHEPNILTTFTTCTISTMQLYTKDMVRFSYIILVHRLPISFLQLWVDGKLKSRSCGLNTSQARFHLLVILCLWQCAINRYIDIINNYYWISPELLTRSPDSLSLLLGVWLARLYKKLILNFHSLLTEMITPQGPQTYRCQVYNIIII